MYITAKKILDKYNLGTKSNITRLKSTLEDKELIETSNGVTALCDPVFRIWFRQSICKHRRFTKIGGVSVSAGTPPVLVAAALQSLAERLLLAATLTGRNNSVYTY